MVSRNHPLRQIPLNLNLSLSVSYLMMNGNTAAIGIPPVLNLPAWRMPVVDNLNYKILEARR